MELNTYEENIAMVRQFLSDVNVEIPEEKIMQISRKGSQREITAKIIETIAEQLEQESDAENLPAEESAETGDKNRYEIATYRIWSTREKKYLYGYAYEMNGQRVFVEDGKRLHTKELDWNSLGRNTTMFLNNKPLYEGDILSICDNTQAKGVIRYGTYTGTNTNQENTNLGFYVEWLDQKQSAIAYRPDLGYWINQKVFVNLST